MNILITICGRAGSKGVKNKNFKEFLGYPLVYYTIAISEMFKKLKKNDFIDVCINSDSEKLLEISKKFDFITPIKRPEELAQDNSAKVPVIRHSLNYMEDKNNKKYEYVIDLDITSPLRKLQDVENSLKKIIDSKVDVVYSVVNSRRNPYFNMVERTTEGLKKVKASNYIRRQDAPEVYDMNASIYCYNSDSLKNILKNSPLDGKNEIILMKDTAVLDIDSEEDFELMSILGKYYFENDFSELKDYIEKNYNLIF